MKKGRVYYLQNGAIHKARYQLERLGAMPCGESLKMVRFMAARLNLGIRSISRLSLKQREILISKLIEMGARVKNPRIYESDLDEERRLAGSKEPRKVIVFRLVSEEQLRMVDHLADQIRWRTPDGYLGFCHKLLRAPRPRNSKEVTRLRLALQSIIAQQGVHDSNTGSLSV